MKCPKCGKKLSTDKDKTDDFPTYICTPECGYNEPQCFGICNHEQTCLCCPEETRCIYTERYDKDLRVVKKYT